MTPSSSTTQVEACVWFLCFFVRTCLFCFCLLLRFCYTHLSGHGSQSTDYDGDEVDGSDETICPVDYKVLIVDNMVNEQCV